MHSIRNRKIKLICYNDRSLSLHVKATKFIFTHFFRKYVDVATRRVIRQCCTSRFFNRPKLFLDIFRGRIIVNIPYIYLLNIARING
ncbi:protein of unknown function [Azospirillum lipoferum 4B]|uniref:Uncharacterized protein n=1 Tax=Azospirillum lipoferum (strain 4B) TaxID=862719 RepID=G7Z7N6_AZOL4|nr:protein of unknown function [Azospirillum lipoferum 4B]